MIKRLAACIREYRRDTILTPLLMIGEVVCECIIPLYTAQLSNQIQAGCSLRRHFSLRHPPAGAGLFVPRLRHGFRLVLRRRIDGALQKISGMICFTAYRAFPSQTSTNFRRPLSSRA